MPANIQGPRVSRETRRLLATVLLSLAALWVLARIRFPERPPTPNPVAPLLTQLNPRLAFEDLERAVSELQPELLPALLAISVEPTVPARGTSPGRPAIAALRFRDDAAVALIVEPGEPIAGVTLVARDRATGLAVVRTPSAPLPELRTWTPVRMEYARYVMVSEVSPGGVYLRPVFLGPLRATPSSRWSADVWRIASRADVPNGAFVFTAAGALAGLVSGQPDDPAIVPARAVIAAAERLGSEGQKPAGWIGVEVQALTAPIRAATGLTSGVAVTWVDPQGGAAGKLFPTDVILEVGEHAVVRPADFEAQAARLTVGAELTMHVRRRGRTEEVAVTALPLPAAGASRELGLTLRIRPRVGSEVVRVQGGSVAMRAGISAGDVLTRIGDVAAPTPAQVIRAFAGSPGGAILVAVTRGAEHIVVALVKP